MDMISYFENKDVLLGGEIVNPLEKDSANSIIGSVSNNNTEALTQQRENSSQENEISDLSGGNTIPRQDRLFGLMKFLLCTLGSTGPNIP